MALSTLSETMSAPLAPRDLSTLSLLKDHGLSLIEIKISQVSAAKGQLIDNVRLPENTRLLCVVRQGKPLLALHNLFLEERDSVFLLTDDEQAVRHLFIV